MDISFASAELLSDKFRRNVLQGIVIEGLLVFFRGRAW